MSSIGPELRNINVPTCARKRTTPKVRDSVEISRHNHVPRGINSDRSSALRRPIAKTLAPQVSTIGPQLRDIDVITSCARKGTAPKVNGAIEVSRHDHVSGGINCDSMSFLNVPITEAFTPKVRAIGPELCNKDVIIARAQKRTAAKVNCAIEISRNDHIPRGIDADSASSLSGPIAEAFTP